MREWAALGICQENGDDGLHGTMDSNLRMDVPCPDCPHLFASRFSTRSSDPSASAEAIWALGQLHHGSMTPLQRKKKPLTTIRRSATTRSFSPPRSNAKGLAEEQSLLRARLLRSYDETRKKEAARVGQFVAIRKPLVV